jgi:hypothetical protein
MWLFTKYGFFSAVCARIGRGEPAQPLDPGRIMVRARLPEHLEALKSAFPDLLRTCEVVETAGSDYAYRIFVPRSAWTRLATLLAEGIDYGNFKSEASRHGASEAYEGALDQVWTTMRDLQERDRPRRR